MKPSFGRVYNPRAASYILKARDTLGTGGSRAGSVRLRRDRYLDAEDRLPARLLHQDLEGPAGLTEGWPGSH
jgi:hypothetical protein